MKTKKKAQAELPLGPGPKGPTMAVMVEYYQRTHLTMKRLHTLRSQRFYLKAFVREMPPYPTAGEIAGWVRAKVDSGEWAESTARNALHVGSHVCRHARNEWPTHVCPDPFAQVTKPEARRLKPRHVEHPVFLRLMEKTCRDDLERAFLCMGYYQGLNVSEVLGLEEEHVNLKLGTITIMQQRAPSASAASAPKTKYRAATLQLHPEALKYLRRARLVVLQDRRGPGRPRSGVLAKRFLFPYWGTDLYRDGKGFFDRLRAAEPDSFPKKTRGRGGCMFHNFRHSLGAALDRAGVSAKRGRSVLRHGSERNTETYYASFRGSEVDQTALDDAWAGLDLAQAEAEEAAAPKAGNLRFLKPGTR